MEIETRGEDYDEPFVMEFDFVDNSKVKYGANGFVDNFVDNSKVKYGMNDSDRSEAGKMETENQYDDADTLMDIVRINDNNMEFADDNN